MASQELLEQLKAAAKSGDAETVAALVDGARQEGGILSGSAPDGGVDRWFTVESTTSYSEWDSWLDELVTRSIAQHQRWTLLQLACREGNAAAAAVLLERGASGSKSNEEVDTVEAPIHMAARAGSVECVRLLVERGGVDVRQRSASGWQALHAAVQMGHLPLVQQLLEHHGVAATERVAHRHVSHYAYRGQSSSTTTVRDETPLHVVAMQVRPASLDIARLLLDRGADINAVTTESHETPLHTAARYGSLEMVTLLLERGADTTIKSKSNCTASQDACERTKPAFAKLAAAGGGSSSSSTTKS